MNLSVFTDSWLVPVQSSTPAAVAYGPCAGLLVIQFYGGRLYEHASITPSEYDDLGPPPAAACI